MDEFAAISVIALVGAVAFGAYTLLRRTRVPPVDRTPAPTTSPSDAVDDTDDRADDSADDHDSRLALLEAEHERDASIARAAEAEERERLALDRLGSLAPLEQRVEIAERRALDAERRLAEIAERVADDRPEGDAGSAEAPTDQAGSPAAELRARLARTAARKKPAGEGR